MLTKHSIHPNGQGDIMSKHISSNKKNLIDDIKINIISHENGLSYHRLRLKDAVNNHSVPTAGILLGEIFRTKNLSIRYSYATVNGNSYLRVQDFEFDIRNNSWYPVIGKCSTIRLHELMAVRGFIQEAIDLAINNNLIDELKLAGYNGSNIFHSKNHNFIQ